MHLLLSAACVHKWLSLTSGPLCKSMGCSSHPKLFKGARPKEILTWLGMMYKETLSDKTLQEPSRLQIWSGRSGLLSGRGLPLNTFLAPSINSFSCRLMIIKMDYGYIYTSMFWRDWAQVITWLWVELHKAESKLFCLCHCLTLAGN